VIITGDVVLFGEELAGSLHTAFRCAGIVIITVSVRLAFGNPCLGIGRIPGFIRFGEVRQVGKLRDIQIADIADFRQFIDVQLADVQRNLEEVPLIRFHVQSQLAGLLVSRRDIPAFASPGWRAGNGHDNHGQCAPERDNSEPEPPVHGAPSLVVASGLRGHYSTNAQSQLRQITGRWTRS
jgi:hypothetical protein